MITPPVPSNEQQRLSALAEFAVIGRHREADFDKITATVAAICEAPIAIISFIEAEREWFKSAVGLSIEGTSRAASFCGHAINDPGGLFVLTDALIDPRFWDNPFVVGEPFVRFYAGAPLTTAEGYVLGTLSVLDRVPRSLSVKQSRALETGARCVVSLLEHRRLYDDLRGEVAQTTESGVRDVVRLFAERPSRIADVTEVDRDAVLHRADILPTDIIDAVPGVFYLVDAGGRTVLWNKRLEEVTGYHASEIAGITPLDLIGPHDRKHVADRIRHAFVHGSANAEASLITKDGREIPYHFTARIVEYKDSLCLAGVGLDISERKQTEDSLRYAAYHDPLTGLRNRTFLSERLIESARSAARKGELVAVLFLDLDRFKVMNDTLGHSAGDELLKAVAQRIRRSVRAGDMIVRLGGDEFVVVADIARKDDVGALVDNLSKAFHQPFAVEGHLLHVTTSIGISVYPSDGVEPEHLLRNADAAMYRAKELGRNTYHFYTSDMHAEAVNRLAIEIDLRHALENGEFELYYQPVIDLRSGAVVCAEALIRWRHPRRGLVKPAGFISIAEETGLIVPIGAWVLREGARQARRLSACGLGSCYISLNVSGRQLRDAAFLDHVRAALQESDPPANSLGIEITESAALGDPDRALAVLNRCKELGFLILLDDFGTHYSSLTYLKKFPIDVIKIDRSFVDGLPADMNDSGIVKAIVALGQGSGCGVIAEGVKSAQQAQWLLAIGCVCATGYFFARPMPARRFERWLQAQQRDERSARGAHN